MSISERFNAIHSISFPNLFGKKKSRKKKEAPWADDAELSFLYTAHKVLQCYKKKVYSLRLIYQAMDAFGIFDHKTVTLNQV